MPICKNCHHPWSFKQTFKRSFTLGRGMKCPYCNELQYYSSRFRKRSSIVPFILVSIIMLGNLFFGPSYISVVALLTSIPLLMVVYPFFIELSNEEERLW